MLRQIEFCKGFSVVGFRRRLKTIGAVPQKHAVNVELENFFFTQACLDLEREQDLRELSDKGLVQRQKVVSCHLHGDG